MLGRPADNVRVLLENRRGYSLLIIYETCCLRDYYVEWSVLFNVACPDNIVCGQFCRFLWIQLYSKYLSYITVVNLAEKL